MNTATGTTIQETDKLQDTVFLLDLHIGQTAFTRRVGADQAQVQAADLTITPEAYKLSKIILDGPELDAIRKLRRDIRDYVERYEIPNTQFRPGMYLLSYNRLEDIEARMVDADEQMSAAVDNLIEAYDRLKDEAAERLGPLFNEDEYPDAATLRKRYYIDYKFVMLSTPEGLKKMSLEAWKREQAKLQRMVEDAAAESRQVIAGEARKLAQHVIDKLTPDEDGKTKKFHDTVLTNWDEFLETFSDRNLTGDEDLATLMADVRAKIHGRSVKELRTSTESAAEIRALFESVVSTLDANVIDKPMRAMRLED